MLYSSVFQVHYFQVYFFIYIFSISAFYHVSKVQTKMVEYTLNKNSSMRMECLGNSTIKM